MYEQGRAFCVQAGTIIFAVTIIVWALGYYPRPASVAATFAARRAVATDADALAAVDQAEAGAYLRHSALGRIGAFVEPVVRPLGWDWRIGMAAIASFPAREVVIATLGTIYNLGGDVDARSGALRARIREVTWPDGTKVYNTAVALSLMVFFALCCQCASTLAVMKRETNTWRWPMFAFVYMTVLAYAAALVTYQVAVRVV
ncbi:MAG: nucleoside recognition domain-containing protein [Phycisphaerae bacterium]